MSLYSVLQKEKKTEPNGNNHPHPNGEGANSNGVSRRPSQRQQEKAPEGQAPRTVDTDAGPNADGGPSSEGAGPAPVESRFQESLE